MSNQRLDEAASPQRPISEREGLPLPRAKRALLKMPGLADTCAGDEDLDLKIEDEDVASEDAIMDLYQRWMGFYNVYREENEQEERFPIFKNIVTSVHKFNHEKHLWKKGLDKLSDSYEDEIDDFLFCSKMEVAFNDEDSESE